jgi:hypothetical protein
MLSTNPLELSKELRQLVFCLTDLTNDEYSYVDKFNEVNTRIFQLTTELIHHIGHTPEEEAQICLAILSASNVVVCREDHFMQCIFDRVHDILPRLAPTLLKCQLLTYSYAEYHLRPLADEALRIIAGWRGRRLTLEELRVKSFLHRLLSQDND